MDRDLSPAAHEAHAKSNDEAPARGRFAQRICVCCGVGLLFAAVMIVTNVRSVPRATAATTPQATKSAAVPPSQDALAFVAFDWQDQATTGLVEDTAFAAENVVGPRQCVDCHRSEYVRWTETMHAGEAFDKIRTSSAAHDYAERLGIPPPQVAVSSRCVKCHATPRVDIHGGPDVVPGVSCESCHGPAGGENGWLNSHGVYGAGGTRRNSETPEHWAQRMSQSRAAGKKSPYDLYSLARRCYECHIVSDELLVNEARHPGVAAGFEFLAKSQGEVRHNFHLDQTENAEVSTLWLDPIHGTSGAGTKSERIANRKRMMLVLGMVADVEITLRNIAAATDDRGNFYRNLSRRVRTSLRGLTQETGRLSTVPPLLQAAIDAAQPMVDKIAGRDFDMQADHDACLAVADVIAEAASEYARTSDGSDLQGIDVPDGN